MLVLSLAAPEKEPEALEELSHTLQLLQETCSHDTLRHSIRSHGHTVFYPDRHFAQKQTGPESSSCR